MLSLLAILPMEDTIRGVMAVDPMHLQPVSEAIARAKLVAVISGAGISKESGIPTFRDAQEGMWAQYDPQQLATAAAFQRDPDLVWSWYMFRAKRVRQAQPNPGHHAVVDLEALVQKVVVLTQNVDRSEEHTSELQSPTNLV